LAEGQIPLEAAILHVADAYDALTTDRPYRPALTRTRALNAITAGSGRQFDRDCVAALVAAACGESRAVA
jgi:putative two-component system response regulator